MSNDYNDARAIAEAAERSDVRAVSVKTIEQQDLHALYCERYEQPNFLSLR